VTGAAAVFAAGKVSGSALRDAAGVTVIVVRLVFSTAGFGAAGLVGFATLVFAGLASFFGAFAARAGVFAALRLTAAFVFALAKRRSFTDGFRKTGARFRACRVKVEARIRGAEPHSPEAERRTGSPDAPFLQTRWSWR
jgi:hypothetical protein